MGRYYMLYIHYDVACRLNLMKPGGGGPPAGSQDVPQPKTGRLHGKCHDLVRSCARAPVSWTPALTMRRSGAAVLPRVLQLVCVGRRG